MLICVDETAEYSSQIDIVIILDQSTSIVASQPYGYDNWYIFILGFCVQLIGSFEISPAFTQIGVIQFSSYVLVDFYLNTYSNVNDITTTVSNLDIYGGDTDIASALSVTRTIMFNRAHGSRQGVRKIAILISDGVANVNVDRTLIEANLTKSDCIEIFTVGVTDQVSESELQAIASEPVDTHHLHVSEYSQLNTILQQLVNNIVEQSPTNNNTCINITTGITVVFTLEQTSVWANAKKQHIIFIKS